MAYKKICAIYSITCRVNEHVYIGQSVNVKQRWKTHRRDLQANRHGNPILQACFKKYGLAALDFLILKVCAPTELDAVERETIIEMKEAAGNRCMNFGTDIRNPMKGRCHSKEARLKMSMSRKGKKRAPRSAEWCLAISEAKRGHVFTIEQRQRMSSARTGLRRSEIAKIKTAERHRGMKRSEESRARMRVASQRRWLRPEERLRASASHIGRRLSTAHRAKLSAALTGRRFSAEHLAKIAATKALSHKNAVV